MEHWRVLLCVAATLSGVRGYRGGAPPEACSTMIPGHGVDPQSSPLPYTVRPSKEVVAPGETITLEVGRPSASAAMLRGLFVQVRNASGPAASPALGTFLPTDGTRVVDCPPGESNAVTHADASSKERVQLRWRVPTELADGEQLVFRTSVVSEYREFWAAHDSAPIRVARAAQPQPDVTPQPPHAEPEPEPHPEPEPDAQGETQTHGGKEGGASHAVPTIALVLVSAGFLAHHLV